MADPENEDPVTETPEPETLTEDSSAEGLAKEAGETKETGETDGHPVADATPQVPEDGKNATDTKDLSSPDFPNMTVNNGAKTGQTLELNRFNDVQVTIAAELGRTNIAIQDLLNLSEGAVFELNRSISAPVELIAQGIPLGNGEVVVVDDSFAIRIKEIYASTT